MKKRQKILAIILICGIVFGYAISVKAVEPEEVSVLHAHYDGCGETSTTVWRESVNSGYLRTVWSDSCHLCGAQHDYYQFDCTCSCGMSWQTTGHACWNSPYGANTGTCSNYQVINCSTLHNHPTTTYACGLTTTSEVATLQIIASTELPTREVELSAVVNNSDSIINLAYTWTDSSDLNNLTIYENGTYSVTVSGENIVPTTVSIEVTNIDKIPPEITSYSADITQRTTGKITLTVEATDNVGLDTDAYSWDGGTTWIADNTKVVNSNGNYKVQVKDLAGNVSEEIYEVTNIYVPQPPADTTPPVIIDLYPDTTEPARQVILTVVVEEPNVLISWDGGITWGSSTTTVALANALHTVYVKDQAGNVDSRSYDVTNIYIPKPQPIQEEIIEEVEVVTEITPIPELPQEETSKKEEAEIVIQTVTIEEPEMKGNVTFWKFVKIAAPASGGGFFFFFGFWFFTKNAAIYSQSGISEKRLGSVRVKKTDKGYQIEVPASMVRKAGSNKYRIKVSKKLSRDAEGMYCKVILNGKEIESRLTREIYVEG